MKQYINPTIACIELQGERIMDSASASSDPKIQGGSQGEARAPKRIDYFKF